MSHLGEVPKAEGVVFCIWLLKTEKLYHARKKNHCKRI